MNQKNIAITAVLSAALLAGIFTTTPLAFADESETNTEQAMRQENIGSGESTNFNCGENSIDGGFLDAQICGTLEIGSDEPMAPQTCEGCLETFLTPDQIESLIDTSAAWDSLEEVCNVWATIGVSRASFVSLMIGLGVDTDDIRDLIDCLQSVGIEFSP